jgi:AcrR family transcriptional regulator
MDMQVPVRSRIPRGAHTLRGQQTRHAILAAARKLCTERWLDQLSLSELARQADTTRASVLFQFPEGWPDIAAQLLVEELEMARAAVDELTRSRLKPEPQLRQSLHYFLKRSEELGALLPNLRAFNYFWSDSTDAIVAPTRDGLLEQIAATIRAAVPGRQSLAESRHAAETLIVNAIDLACAPMYRRLRSEERGARLDYLITIVLNSLTRR